MIDDVLKLAARSLLAVPFLVTGVTKLADPSGIARMLGALNLPAPEFLGWLVGLCEVVGGLALVTGILVRIAGPLLALWCVVAGLVVHLHMPIDLMKNLALAGGLLLVAATDAGSLSLASFSKRETRAAQA